MKVPTVCWRCRRLPVRTFGVACRPCLTILHAEYDAQRAANGGHLLYIPDDWDGPALPVNDHVGLCIDCGDTFAMSKHAKGTKVRCEECQARRTRETWQAKRKRPAAAWPIDIADV